MLRKQQTQIFVSTARFLKGSERATVSGRFWPANFDQFGYGRGLCTCLALSKISGTYIWSCLVMATPSCSSKISNHLKGTHLVYGRWKLQKVKVTSFVQHVPEYAFQKRFFCTLFSSVPVAWRISIIEFCRCINSHEMSTLCVTSTDITTHQQLGN